MKMDESRLTGKTTSMLNEALSHRENSEQFPVLIVGANQRHVSTLIDMFISIVKSDGNNIKVDRNKNRVILDDTDIFEFCSIDRDSSRGLDYSYIFIDHFAFEPR